MRLLLINPKFPESFWSFRWALNEVLRGKRAVNPPLGLATLAALCPPDWEVEIIDENVEPVPLLPQADLIGVCGMGVQFGRQKELLEYYRSKGYRTVAGGSYASLCPEKYASLADTVIAGEAEYIWPEFCRDYAIDCAQTLYHETGEVSLEDSPAPRFDLLKLDRYTSATMQFSRGCPFRCEFCDIIVMFGRKPRTKRPEQIGRELDVLRAAGMRSVFFVDDNLIGHKPDVKALLRYLIDYQKRHDYAFSFGTEASLNLAESQELLDLFREANFTWVFIGIETPDPASLKETLKTQNMQTDILGSVQRLYQNGIDVLGGFIIGFDNDTLDSFEMQRRFIMDSGIQAAMVGLLTALPRTPLYERLEKEGRLRLDADHTDNTKLGTNVIPKQMEYEAMVEAYRDLYRKLESDHGIAERIRNKLRHLHVPHKYQSTYTTRESIAIVTRIITKGILPGGPLRLWYFLRTFPFLTPRKIPLVMVEWITGLTMQDYVRRHFGMAGSTRSPERLIDATRNAIARYVDQGSAALADRSHGADLRLSLSLGGALDRRFFVRVSAHLEQLLKYTPATLTLRLEALWQADQGELDTLLERLKRYGDRVFIVVDERIRHLVKVDSSVFHLVLAQAR